MENDDKLNVYLIGYDIHDKDEKVPTGESGRRTILTDMLENKDFSHKFIIDSEHCTDSTWLIKSNKNTDEFYDIISSFFNDEDDFLILKLPDNSDDIKWHSSEIERDTSELIAKMFSGLKDEEFITNFNEFVKKKYRPSKDAKRPKKDL